MMENEGNKDEAKVNALLESWTDLCHRLEAKDFLPKTRVLFKETALLLLGPNWNRVSTIAKSKLTLILHQSSQTAASKCARSKDLVETLMELLLDPWGNAALKEVLNTDCNGPEQIALYDYYCKTEKAEVSWLRLQTLEENRCEDLALKLCTCCLQCSMMSNERQLVDMNTRLLFHEGLFEQLNQEMSRYSCHDGLEMIQRIWSTHRKDSMLLAIYLSNLFLVKDMVLPSQYCCTKQLMAMWINLQLLQNDDDLSLLRKEILKICSLATTSAHFYLMVDLLNEKFGDQMLRLHVELYVRGLTVDINFLENVRLSDCASRISEIEHHVANMLERLSLLLGKHKRLARECILTAFSIDPTEERLVSLEKYVDILKPSYHSVNGVPIVPCSGQCHCEKKGECRRLLKEAGIILDDATSNGTATLNADDEVEMDASSPLPEVSVDELNEICSATDGDQRDVGTDLESVDNQICLEAENLLKTSFFQNKEARRTPSKELSSHSECNPLPSFMLFADVPMTEASTVNQWSDSIFRSSSPVVKPQLPQHVHATRDADHCLDHLSERLNAQKYVHEVNNSDDIYTCHSAVLDVDIGIDRELLSDLSIVLDEPRHKVLRWDVAWDDLKDRCRLYLHMRYAKRTMLRAISLSQENDEDIEAVEIAKEQEIKVVSVENVEESVKEEPKTFTEEPRRKTSKARKEKQKELATLVNVSTRDFNIASMKFLNPKVVISHSDIVDANRQLQGGKNGGGGGASNGKIECAAVAEKSFSTHGSVLRDVLTGGLTSNMLRAYRPRSIDASKRINQLNSTVFNKTTADDSLQPIGFPPVAMPDMKAPIVTGTQPKADANKIASNPNDAAASKLLLKKTAAANSEIALLCQKDYQNACEQLSQHILLHTSPSNLEPKQDGADVAKEQHKINNNSADAKDGQAEATAQQNSSVVPVHRPKEITKHAAPEGNAMLSIGAMSKMSIPTVVQKVHIKSENFSLGPSTSSAANNLFNETDAILKPESFPNPLMMINGGGQRQETRVCQSLQNPLVSVPSLSQLTNVYPTQIGAVQDGISLVSAHHANTQTTVNNNIVESLPTNAAVQQNDDLTTSFIEQFLSESLGVGRAQSTNNNLPTLVQQRQTNGTCVQADAGPPNENGNVLEVTSNDEAFVASSNLQNEMMKVNSVSLPTNFVFQNVELQVDTGMEGTMPSMVDHNSRPVAPQTYVIKMIDLSNAAALAVDGKQLTLIKAQPEVPGEMQIDVNRIELQGLNQHGNGFGESATTLAVVAGNAQFQEVSAVNDATFACKQMLLARPLPNHSVVPASATFIPPRVASAPPASRPSSPLLQALMEQASKVYEGTESGVASLKPKQKLFSKRNDKKWVSVRSQHGGMGYRKAGHVSAAAPKSRYNFVRPATPSPQLFQTMAAAPSFLMNHAAVNYAPSNIMTTTQQAVAAAETDVKIAIPVMSAIPDPVFIKEFPRIVDMGVQGKASVVVPIRIHNSKEGGVASNPQMLTEKLQQYFVNAVKVNGVVEMHNAAVLAPPNPEPLPATFVACPDDGAERKQPPCAAKAMPEPNAAVQTPPPTATSVSHNLNATSLPLSLPAQPADIREPPGNATQTVAGTTTTNNNFVPGGVGNASTSATTDIAAAIHANSDDGTKSLDGLTRSNLPAADSSSRNVGSGQKPSKSRPKKKKTTSPESSQPSADEFARHVSELIQSVKRSQEMMEEKEAKSKKRKSDSDKLQKTSAKKESSKTKGDDKSNSAAANKPTCSICDHKFCSTFSLRRHLIKVHKLDSATIQAEKLSKSTVAATTTVAPPAFDIPNTAAAATATAAATTTPDKFTQEERIEPTLYRPSKNERDVLMCQTEEMPKLLFETTGANDCQLDNYEQNQENFEATSAHFNLFTDAEHEYGGFTLFSDQEVESAYPLGSGLDDDETDLMSRIDDENKISRGFDMSTLAENFDINAPSSLKTCDADPDLGKAHDADVGLAKTGEAEAELVKPCTTPDLSKTCDVVVAAAEPAPTAPRMMTNKTCDDAGPGATKAPDPPPPNNVTLPNEAAACSSTKSLEPLPLPLPSLEWAKDTDDTSTEGSIDSTSFIKGRTRGRAKGANRRNCPCCEEAPSAAPPKRCRTDNRGSNRAPRKRDAKAQDSRSRNASKR